MNYELAKELKDAGFPNSAEWTLGEVVGEGMQCFYDDGDSIHYKPTLSELIEACGEDFLRLELIGATRTGGVKFGKLIETWEAHSKIDGVLIQVGSTPDEAVARLWLALQSKKNV